MYVGFLLALIGWATFLSHTLPFLLLPVYVAFMNRFQIFPRSARCLPSSAMNMKRTSKPYVGGYEA